MIKKKLLISSLILVVALMIFAAVGLLFILPELRRLQNILAEKRSLDQEIAQAQDYLNFLDKEDKPGGRIETLYRKSLIYLPESTNQSNFILQVNEIGRNASLAVSKLVIGDQKKDQVEFTMELKGDYQGMVVFFANLKNALKVTAIDNLSFSLSDNNKVVAQIKGRVFFEPIPEQMEITRTKFSSDVKILDDLTEFGEPISSEEVPGGSSEPFGQL